MHDRTYICFQLNLNIRYICTISQFKFQIDSRGLESSRSDLNPPGLRIISTFEWENAVGYVYTGVIGHRMALQQDTNTRTVTATEQEEGTQEVSAHSLLAVSNR